MKLSPFLASHFCADRKEDVPPAIWQNAVTSTRRVLDNPGKFPQADFEYLNELETQLLVHQL